MSATQQSLLNASRIKPLELAAWALLFASPFVFPSQGALITEIAIVALFAVSLDLVLGYTGIVSLGHAAFFGFGAYVAALLCKHVTNDPHIGLLVAMAGSALLGLLASFTVLRGSDLTRLMVTLGLALLLFELANKLDWLTGGIDGIQGLMFAPLLGQFEFDIAYRTASFYALAVLLVLTLVARRIVHSPFGATLKAIRDNRLRAMAIGIPVNARLVAIYTIAAAIAGAAGALFTQTSGFASINLFDIQRSADLMLIIVIGGVGWLYGGIIGAVVFTLMHHFLSAITPQYWMFWLGLFLVVLVVVGRDRLFKPWTWFKRGSAA
jgi:branched-chain amino acid transport system permease protein